MSREPTDHPLPRWSDFAGAVPARLNLPIYEFSYSLRYVPVALEPQQRRHAMNIVTNAAVAALRAEPDTSLTALRVKFNPKDLIEPDTDQEEPYFSVQYAGPVFDFLLQMGPTTFRLSKKRATLQDLLRACALFSKIAAVLRTPAEDSPTGGPTSFAHVGISLSFISLSLLWKHRLVLGTHLGNDQEALNFELLAQLARLGPEGQAKIHPLQSLELDSVRRGELRLAFTKEIDSRPRTLWINYDGPWNVTRQDCDLEFGYVLGDPGVPLEETDLTDFHTPFVSFYRDEVLNGFCADFFSSVNVSGKP